MTGHLSSALRNQKSSTKYVEDGSTKTRNPETEKESRERKRKRKQKQKRKRNTESNINDRKLKNFTLHNLVQSKENLFQFSWQFP